MKTSANDLDSTVLEKLNRLDAISEAGKSGLVRYDGESYTTVSTDFLNLSRVFSVDDINNMKKHFYKSEDNYISGFDTIMATDSTAIGTTALLSELVGSFHFQTSGKILKVKPYATFFLVLDSLGKIYKIDSSNTSIQQVVDALNIIRTNFVYKNIDAYSIVDFDYWGNNVLVATEFNGVYYMSLADANSFGLKIKETDISKIAVLGDGKTLMIAKNTIASNVVTYDLETEVKTSVYNNLSKTNEKTEDLLVDGKCVFALSKSYGITFPDRILHAWKLDSEGIEYENIDRMISRNPVDYDYHPKFITSDSTSVYVIGEAKSQMFIWSYNKGEISAVPDEMVLGIESVRITDIKDFAYNNGQYIVAIKNKILILDNDFNLIENYILKGVAETDDVVIKNGRIYSISDKICNLFLIPGKKYQKVLKINLFEDTSHCNNFDILIWAPTTMRAHLFDMTTKTEINPYFYLKFGSSYHVIKLTGVDLKTVVMQIDATETDKINAIVVHKNRIFYK